MDRRGFLKAAGVGLATPVMLMGSDALADTPVVLEDCSWQLPELIWRDDGEWHHVVEARDGKKYMKWLDGVLVSTIQINPAGEYLAKKLNEARERIGVEPCEIDPRLMADCQVWARSMARRNRMVHDQDSENAEIIAMGGSYADAVNLWWNSRGGRRRGFFRRRRSGGGGGHFAIMTGTRYTRIGAGVAHSRRGIDYSVARYA